MRPILELPGHAGFGEPASAHPAMSNFIFANRFSDHGLQQSPAIGRGVSGLIICGEYRSLDMTPIGYDRIERCDPFVETAII
jgi:glycine/D-amino acid oxidase-like deaminating enzyme